MSDAILAILCGVAGLTLLRAAWWLATADTRQHRRDYPNVRAVLMGRSSRAGRRSMFLNRRRGRIEFH